MPPPPGITRHGSLRGIVQIARWTLRHAKKNRPHFGTDKDARRSRYRVVYYAFTAVR
jgi:hypothetical protein